MGERAARLSLCAACAGNGVLTAARDRCPHRVAPLSLEQVIAFDRCIGMEDKTMLERISGMLSLDIVATATGERAVVDRLFDALVADGYTVKRDTMDLGYKGLISDFMRELGRGDCVVVLISDAYLRSPFCMFELLEIYRHHEFRERICPIVLADAHLHTPEDRLIYVTYWQEKATSFQQSIQQIGIQSLSASGSFQSYEMYRDIAYYADKLVSYLADINSQTPQLLEANDFATLKQAIDARLQSLRPS